jgi:tRNA(fMet)-specific endonuclease VapC
MIRYILDTDILTLLQHRHPAVVGRVSREKPDELAITILSVEEQLSGWYRQLRQAKDPAELAKVYDYLTNAVRSFTGLPIVSFSESAILRAKVLSSQRLNVRKTDLSIGAIALERGATLATRNLRDYQRIPGLKVEDWSTPSTP